MEEVEELLKNWELPDLIPIFTEQQITVHALSALTNETIKELIPKTGPRVLFLRCWRAWKGEFDTTSSVCLDISNLDFALLDDGASVDVQLPTLSSSLPLREIENISPANFNNTVDSVQCPILEELLSNSLETSTLLAYKGGALLGDTGRNLLASAISHQILKEHKGTTITGATYYKWANYIKQLYPGERTTTYYIPACTTANGIVRQARGKIVHQVLNKRRKLQQLGALPIRKRSREASPASSVPSPRPLPGCFTGEIEDNSKEDLQWLETSSEPWFMVDQKWRNTGSLRMKLVHKKNEPVEAYFAKYPALQKPTGYKLLHADFDIAHEQEKDNLFMHYPLMKPTLLKLLKNKKVATDASTKDLIRLADSSNEETTNLVGFLAIPYLINPSTCRQVKYRKSLESWKPSKIEARDGFIKHLRTDAEIAQHIEQRLSSLEKKKTPSQPYIIIVGESLEEIKSYFVVANRLVLYERLSIAEAIDTCYKIVWALNVEYGPDTYPIWYFIQKALFKMTSKYDKGSTAAESLLTDCGIL